MRHPRTENYVCVLYVYSRRQQLTQPHLHLVAVVWQDVRDILGITEPDDREWRHNALVEGWIEPWLRLDQFVVTVRTVAYSQDV